MALKTLNFSPFVAGSTAEVIECARTRPFIAVIADMNVFRSANTPLASTIRQVRAAQRVVAPSAARLTIILTTELDDLESHVESVRFGADLYLTAGAAASPEILGHYLEASSRAAPDGG